MSGIHSTSFVPGEAREVPDMKPVVSVVIPYYHGARYLDDLLTMMHCNAELLREKRGESAELVFVNDSPEETLQIPEQKLFQVKILTNSSNQGIHASRVDGLREAEGEYILFLDQDDRITDTCLNSQLEHIGEADFVIGNGMELLQDGSRKVIFSSREKQLCAADVKCHYFYNNLIRSPGQVLFRKTATPPYWTDHIMKNNGSDDAFLWILMLCSGKRAAINEETVYEHVYTGENTSASDEGMLRSQREAAALLKGRADPFGMWAFRRRAEYYCLNGSGHSIRYADVGILRFLYAKRHMQRNRKDRRCERELK